MREGDRAYFARRAQEETAAASNAKSPKAAQSHRELSEHYSKMSASIPDQAEPQAPLDQRPATGSAGRVRRFRQE
jgi:hypothetical protein